MSESGMPGLGCPSRRLRLHRLEEKLARYDRKRGYEGWRMRLDQIANVELLNLAYLRLKYEGGLAPGPEFVTYADLSPEEVFNALRKTAKAMLDGTYWPARTRDIKKAKLTPGEFRVLKLANLMDRVVGKAVQIVTRPFWERRFFRNSFAYRPNRGGWDMLASIEVAMRRTGRRVLAIDDVKTAFDAVPVNRLVELHRSAFAKLRLKHFGADEQHRTVELINRILRGNDPHRITGIDQGGCYSPTGLNVLLNYEHDRPLQKLPAKPLCFRYSDNLAYLTQSVTDGRQVLDQADNLLLSLGMSLKRNDGIYDPTSGESASLLGYDLHWYGLGITMNPNHKAWMTLCNRLKECHKTPNPSRAAARLLVQWVTAYTPGIRDNELDKVVTTAADLGFREYREDSLVEAWKLANGRWERCRQRAARRYRPEA